MKPGKALLSFLIFILIASASLNFAQDTKQIKIEFSNKNYSKVISDCESFYARNPKNAWEADSYYFKALLQTDPDKAYKFARSLKGKNDSPGRAMFIATLCTPKEIGKRFHLFAIDVLKVYLKEDISNSMAADYFAVMDLEKIYENVGDYKNAIAATRKMIDWAKAHNTGDSLITVFNKKIEKLKAAK